MMLPLSWIHILWTPLHHQKHQISMVMIDFRSFLKNSFFFGKFYYSLSSSASIPFQNWMRGFPALCHSLLARRL